MRDACYHAQPRQNLIMKPCSCGITNWQYPGEVPIPESNRQPAEAFVLETGSLMVIAPTVPRTESAQARLADANSLLRVLSLFNPMTYPVSTLGPSIPSPLPLPVDSFHQTRLTAPFVPSSPRLLDSANLPAYASMPRILVWPSQASLVSPGGTGHFGRPRSPSIR